MKIYKQILIKTVPEDFIVKEVPNLPFDMSKNPLRTGFTILKLTKVGLTTLEALRVVAEELNLSNEQIQCLGLKDEDGLTEQVVSIEAVLSEGEIQKVQESCRETVAPNEIRLELYGYSPTALEVKRLHGNIFTVRLRNLTKKQAFLLSESIKNNQSHTFISYYDQQRFGLPGGPYLTHLIGKSLVDNDLSAAFDYYVESGNAKLDGISSSVNPQEWVKQLDAKKFDFFISAYTSYLWNNKVSRDIAVQKNALPLEIFKEYSLYVSLNPELKPIQKVNGYRGDKDKVIEEYNKSRQIYINTNIFCNQPEKIANTFTITLDFFLPMGCYATMAIKQLLAVRLGK